MGQSNSEDTGGGFGAQIKLDATGLRFAFVASRFNEVITSRLLAGAREALFRHGAVEGQLTVVWAPGAWELPVVAKALALSGRFDAVVALGCVIRGQTDHHAHVAAGCIKGLAQLSLEVGIAVGLGVLTTDTLEQAMERAGGKGGNKGADSALAALETALLLRQIEARSGS